MMNLECESLSSAGLEHLKEVDEILRTESQLESDAQSDHSDSEFRSQELVIIVHCELDIGDDPVIKFWFE